MKHLVIGGARSGKSAFAERAALQRSQRPGYIATAQAGDDEMATRIARHQSHRDDCWQVLEEPLQLAAALRQLSATADVIVVDCLTLWLSNCLHAGCC